VDYRYENSFRRQRQEMDGASKPENKVKESLYKLIGDRLAVRSVSLGARPIVHDRCCQAGFNVALVVSLSINFPPIEPI
jgi:hypothetical protein